ncbi:MAG: hypothetical protein J2P17_07810, partial [Mycobacterium sp.]|nr:hypothetical protein [Mycobacterium sp.]
FGVGGVTSGEQEHDAQPRTIPTVATAYSNLAIRRKYRQPRGRRNWVPTGRCTTNWCTTSRATLRRWDGVAGGVSGHRSQRYPVGQVAAA